MAGCLWACNSKKTTYDASGTFEVDETVVSSEIAGKLLTFNVQEGDTLAQGAIVGTVDPTQLHLQKAQVEASIAALKEKTSDIKPEVKLLEDQLRVQQSQLDNLYYERTRTENLIKRDAATTKQLDDLNNQIDVMLRQMTVTKQQIAVQRNNIGTQNRSVLSEGNPLQKQVAQINDQIKRTEIVNPLTGTVITKYAEPGEVTSAGKALYKIANLSYINLRAYITGNQLPLIKLGQEVSVLIDSGAHQYRHYTGNISWISDKAEFTPKTIQTKEERANLVYAIKIRVRNDGYIKIGMYGEVLFK